jgi:hypothetical protein
VNKFFLLSLLFYNLAFAQDVPVEPKKSEPIIMDVDPRCKNAVTWGVSLIVKKTNGQTHEQTKRRLEYDYLFGALKDARPEVLAYMFDIVDLVYGHNTTTIPEIKQTAEDVNTLCVEFMDTPREEPKPLPIKT